MTWACPACGTEFSEKPVKDGVGGCPECGTYRECEYCGTPCATDRRFCSRRCAIVARNKSAKMRAQVRLSKLGARNPNWRGDKAKTQAGRRRALFAHDLPTQCETCGREGYVERHHRDGNTLHNERENIAFLCRRCHMIVDGRLAALIARNRGDDPSR